MEMELTPINVAMIAPTGAGKTSLLSTIVQYIKDDLNVADGFGIKPSNRKDEDVLNTFNSDLRAKIDAEDFKFESGFLAGTTVSRKFEFEITLTSQADTVVKQKFVIMDIPGAWLEPDQRTNVSGWDEFKDHLYKSRIIWIPVEATVLMEVNQNSASEKGASSKISCRDEIEELVKEWAQFRQKDGLPASANFVITKCETYHSKDDSKGNIKASQCRDLFSKYYDEAIDRIRKECPQVEISYGPVETVGCVKCIDSDWNTSEKDKPYLSCEYAVTSPHKRVIAGAESLVSPILDYAVAQIQAELKSMSDEAEDIFKENEDSTFVSIVNYVLGETKRAKKQKAEVKKLYPCLVKLGTKLEQLRQAGDQYKYYKHL